MLGLSNEQIMQAAPSVFATQPWEGMSDKYRFIPTIEVLEAMRENGFVPVKVQQSSARIPGKSDFTKHMIRFRHAESAQLGKAAIEARSQHLHHIIKADDLPEVPEICLVNSHDGTSGYHINMGLYRQVCANGLMVCSSEISSIRTRHSGRQDILKEVIDGSFEVIENAPAVAARVAEFKQILLPAPQQEAFAHAALEIKSENAPNTFDAARLLQVRRYEDKGDEDNRRDLWKTMNVVQENLIRGGVRGRSATGRRVTSKAVKSVNEDIRINRAIWTLTEQMAKLAA